MRHVSALAKTEEEGGPNPKVTYLYDGECPLRKQEIVVGYMWGAVAASWWVVESAHRFNDA